MMCFKKKEGLPDGREPDEHVPSQAWLDGEMPTYSKEDLIEHYKYRAGIHLYWIENPRADFGNEEYHWWAIEGYENRIYYLNDN